MEINKIIKIYKKDEKDLPLFAKKFFEKHNAEDIVYCRRFVDDSRKIILHHIYTVTDDDITDIVIATYRMEGDATFASIHHKNYPLIEVLDEFEAFAYLQDYSARKELLDNE